MKKTIIIPTFIMLLLTLQSCELIGDIFKAGVWTGIIVVAIVIGLIIWLVSKIL